MKKNFYRAFEDKYRGSRELITGRLQFYLPFIKPLVREFGRVPAIDLGCGRGEWLEVLLAAGLDARGIDLDECMLQACVDLGLPADKGEAIAHLRGLPSKSQAIVSAFHVVEHISFDALQELVSEAKRVLLPGGLLILETPNPENIMVATCSFYLDPTHQRPIPPNLLSFVAEHAGFERVKVIRLQESKELASKPDLLLEDVLGGVSPDYSVVAQKKGKKSTMTALEPVFSQDYGLTLGGLSSRYDAHMKGKLGEDRLKLMQERFEAEKNRADNLATERGQLAERVTALESERSTLSSDNASLATSNSLLTTEREALQKELQEIHHANHTHWQRSEDLKQELAAKELAWSEERSTLDARLSTLIAERDALATEREALTARLEELAGQAAVANAQREALQQQVSAKDEALAAIRETLTAERLTFEAQRSLLASEKSALDTRLSTLVSENTSLATSNSLLATEREALTARLEEIAGEAAVARAQSESLRQEMAAKEQARSEERSTLDARLSTLLAERDAQSVQLSTLEQKLAGKEEVLDATREALVLSETSVRDQKQRAELLERKCDEARESIASAQFAQQEMKEWADMLNAELEQSLADLAAIRETLSAERSTFAARLSTLDSEKALLLTEHHELSNRLSLIGAERDALRQKLAANQESWAAERSTLDSRLSVLLAERDSLATSHSLLATEREALSVRHSTLVSEHDALHQANHGHWQLSENLKQELAAKEQAWSEERSTLAARRSSLLAERDALATERNALLASTCWRITAPIRWVRGGVRIPWPAPNEPLDDFFLKHAALYISRRPHLKERALRFLFQNPKWHARVLPVLQVIKASTPSPQAVQHIPQPVELLQPAPQPAPLLEVFPPQALPAPIPEPAAVHVEPIVDLSSLTPHARRIYSDLKKAIEMKKGEVSA
jgi:SAM-dependent methyltransferase